MFLNLLIRAINIKLCFHYIIIFYFSLKAIKNIFEWYVCGLKNNNDNIKVYNISAVMICFKFFSVVFYSIYIVIRVNFNSYTWLLNNTRLLLWRVQILCIIEFNLTLHIMFLHRFFYMYNNNMLILLHKINI